MRATVGAAGMWSETMHIGSYSRPVLAGLLLMAAAPVAQAASPIGVWTDHTGRGAVEIAVCGASLCGHVVWVKSANHKDGCNVQIIGDAKAQGTRWVGGWIYDPDTQTRFDVELTLMSEQKLKVLGYAGLKMFGETMIWTRAATNLPRCNDTAAPQFANAPVALPDTSPATASVGEPAAAPNPRPPEPLTQLSSATAAAPSSPVRVPEIDEAPVRSEVEPPAPRMSEAPASKSPRAGNPAGSLPRLLEQAGISVKQRPAGVRGQRCTVDIPDIGTFSFSC